jgi:hypothetical protein
MTIQGVALWRRTSHPESPAAARCWPQCASAEAVLEPSMVLQHSVQVLKEQGGLSERKARQPQIAASCQHPSCLGSCPAWARRRCAAQLQCARAHPRLARPPAQASYIRDVADHFANGQLSDSIIAELDPQALMQQLTSIRGVGPWTVGSRRCHCRCPQIAPGCCIVHCSAAGSGAWVPSVCIPACEAAATPPPTLPRGALPRRRCTCLPCSTSARPTSCPWATWGCARCGQGGPP